MDSNNIVFWFSIIVSVLVVFWAIIAIRAYDKIGKD